MNISPNVCFYSVEQYGWFRFGTFFPAEIWGNGPFLHGDRKMAQSKDVEIEIEVLGQTDKALRVSNGKVEAWVPKSQISDECEENGKTTSIFIPEWLAVDKGLV